MKSDRLFHPAMYRFGEAQPSYWEATARAGHPPGEPVAGDHSCDVAIIGGGYTGLSAALHLARDHGIEARVLEAGHLGWGASGRNGGFCSIGGTALELKALLSRYGLEETRRYARAQVEAVELVRAIARDEGFDIAMQGDGELEVAHHPGVFAGMQEKAKAQTRLLGLDTKVFTADQFRERYFDSTEQHGAVRVRPTFGLHPLKFLNGLAAAAGTHGAVLHPNSEVIEWSRQGERHHLVTAGGSLRANTVILATNGFTPEHLHPSFHGRPLPLISCIVVTRPLTDDELARECWRTECPAINSRNVLNYFRLLPDRRFLFGGRGDTSGDDEGARKTADSLVRQLGSYWPAWRDIDIEYRWHGLICYTRGFRPAIGRLPEDPSVLYGYGFHGNGVNTATWTGRQLARLVVRGAADKKSVADLLPALVRGQSGSFPLPALRRRYIQTGLLLYRIGDRLH